MLKTINQYADYLGSASLLSYPISLLLGFIAGMAAITCFLPLVPLLISFIGGQEITTKRLFIYPFFIMLGSILILAALGVIVSIAGLTLQNALGPYWNYLVGAVCILLSLILLKIIKLPQINLPQFKGKGLFGALLFGILIGGVIGIGSSCCIPTLPIVLAYAGIQGKPVHGALILSSFAIGQSIPIFAIGLFSSVLGKIMAKWSFYVQKIMAVLLLVLGVYFIIWR